MVTPNRRRQAVTVLENEFGVSHDGRVELLVSTGRHNAINPNQLHLKKFRTGNGYADSLVTVPVGDGDEPTLDSELKGLW